MVRNKNIKSRLIFGIAAVGMLLLTSACQTDGSSDKDFFPADSSSAVKKVADAQAASGAQMDATLYPTNFDGNALNSLGRMKLDSITQTLPDEGPVTIYLVGTAATTVPADQATNRRDAVSQYLLNSHLTNDQFKLVDGPNPNVTNSSGNALANYSKTDTGAANDQTGSASSTADSANAAAH